MILRNNSLEGFKTTKLRRVKTIYIATVKFKLARPKKD